MNKRKRIRELEREIERMQEEDMRSSNVLWRIFQVLCDEFDMHLTLRPKDGADEGEAFDVLGAAARRWTDALDDSVSDDEWDDATAALIKTTNELVP